MRNNSSSWRRRLLRVAAVLVATIAGGVVAASPAQADPPYGLVTASGVYCRGAYAVVAFGVSLEPCIWPTGDTTQLGHLQPDVHVHEGTTSVFVNWSINQVDDNNVVSPNPWNGIVHSASVPAGSSIVTVGDSSGQIETFQCSDSGNHFVVSSWLTRNGTRYGNVEGPQFWCSYH